MNNTSSSRINNNCNTNSENKINAVMPGVYFEITIIIIIIIMSIRIILIIIACTNVAMNIMK